MCPGLRVRCGPEETDLECLNPWPLSLSLPYFLPFSHIFLFFSSHLSPLFILRLSLSTLSSLWSFSICFCVPQILLTFPFFFSVCVHYLLLYSSLFPCIHHLLLPARTPPALYGRRRAPPPCSLSTSPVPLTPHAAPIPRKPLQTLSAIKDHSQSGRQSASQPVRQPVSQPSALT